jgi:hypothetical protein
MFVYLVYVGSCTWIPAYTLFVSKVCVAMAQFLDEPVSYLSLR